MAGADEKKESEPPAAGKGGGSPEDKKGGGGEKSGGGGEKGGKSSKGDAEVAAVVAPKEIEEVRVREGGDRCGCQSGCCLTLRAPPPQQQCLVFSSSTL